MNKSSVLAFFLALIPGFGHMYLGQKRKGVLYPLLFFGTIGFGTFAYFISAFNGFIPLTLLGAFLIWAVNVIDMIITLLMRSKVQTSGQSADTTVPSPSAIVSQPENYNERFTTILLSFIPGVGHFQLGLNQRGLTFLAGFFGVASMIFFVAFVSHQGGFLIFLLAMPIIWIYSFFDAIQLLNKKQNGETLEDRTIIEDLDQYREEGKKSKMLATILAIFPGAGHMYLGLQRRGLQLMAAFLLSIYVLDVLRLSIFLFLIPIIWFFSFFDALQHTNKAEQGDLQDIPIVKYLANHQKWLGIALLALGLFYIADSILLPVIAEQVRNAFQIDLWYYYHQYFQVSVVCLLLIAGGIRLIIGSKPKKGGNEQ
ncbi:hypothetical protein ERJ70_17715 [Sediminibacillus dalangtanensis]|uniref:TM2 domain-containing protein n=1 Tax=Sediminibacillus dalangtanensis TaxID=2729421 RepID=A0ABX7W133_9BACI|nr:hypothetical protein [Sediminibacillus dalangtanensis]QTN00962.1 hypothetical protein ERJ70_17715 [Sediminibacillus dalangtanensis]